MLLSLRATSEAARALAYYAAAQSDRARHAEDGDARARAARRLDLLIPVVKACGTETGLEAASTNIQVHGGMGFIEETGAAQHFRDARITLIYEGTNGIQASDLVARKLARDGGAALRELLFDMRMTAREEPLLRGIEALEHASDGMIETFARDAPRALAGSVPYLRLLGIVAGGWLMAEGALAAGRRLAAGAGDRRFLEAKLATARFYDEHMLPQAPGLVAAALGGSVMGFDPELL
jgi:hypothetical protein